MHDAGKSSATLLPLSWVTKSFAGHGGYFAEILFLSVVLRLLGLVGPFAMQAIIDRVLPYQREASLTIVLAVLIGVAVFDVLLSISAARVGAWAGARIGRDLGLRALEHVLALPLPILMRWTIGDVFGRMGEVGQISGFLSGVFMGLVLDLVFALVFLVVLFTISPTLATILLITAPVQAAVLIVSGPIHRRRLDASFMGQTAHSTRVVETMAGRRRSRRLALS